MEVSDPLALDRKLRRTATAWRRWRRRLARGEGLDEDPFEGAREATGRVGFDAVRSMHEQDPLRLPLLRWVYRLMEQRIDRSALCSVASEWSLEQHVLEQPERAKLTLQAIARRALGDPARRPRWLAGFALSAAAHSSAVSLLWERRQEIARRLGLERFDALEPESQEITRAAQAWLETTRERAGEWRSGELTVVIGAALGTDAMHGWPSRLTLARLADFFRETRLLDGLDLDPGPLCEPVAAASFLRGFARLGAAFSEVAVSPALPFSVACDPLGLRRRAHGALFALLPLEPAFQRRALGLSAGAAREQLRALARVVLLESRAAALRVLLRDKALSGRASLQAATEPLSEAAFGTPLPGRIAGSVWRLHTDDPQRFAGLLCGASLVRELVDAHDEDWYRNPRAADQLRSEAALAPETQAGPRLQSGAAALFEALSTRLG
jgi:hypothetical protein